MGREVVLFKDTKEVAAPRREKREADSGNNRLAQKTGVSKAKKNISKKDADKRAMFKKAERIERLKEQSQKKG